MVLATLQSSLLLIRISVSISIFISVIRLSSSPWALVARVLLLMLLMLAFMLVFMRRFFLYGFLSAYVLSFKNKSAIAAAYYTSYMTLPSAGDDADHTPPDLLNAVLVDGVNWNHECYTSHKFDTS